MENTPKTAEDYNVRAMFHRIKIQYTPNVRPIFMLAYVFFIFCTFSAESAYAQFGVVDVNIIRGSVRGRVVVLNWIQKNEGGESYVLVRRNGKFRPNNIRRADIVAEIPASSLQFADVVPATGRYYYALIPMGLFNSKERIEIAEHRYTKNPVVVNVTSPSTMESVIVEKINASSQKGSIVLTYDVPTDNADLIVYRSTTPLYQYSDLQNAVQIGRFIDSAGQIADPSPPNVPVYYSIQDGKLIDRDIGIVLRGVNTTAEPVSLLPFTREEILNPFENNAARENTSGIENPFAPQVTDTPGIENPFAPQTADTPAERDSLDQSFAEVIQGMRNSSLPTGAQQTVDTTTSGRDTGIPREQNRLTASTEDEPETDDLLNNKIIDSFLSQNTSNQPEPKETESKNESDSLAQKVIDALITQSLLDQVESKDGGGEPNVFTHRIIDAFIAQNLLDQPEPQEAPIGVDAIADRVIERLKAQNLLSQPEVKEEGDEDEVDSLAHKIVDTFITQNMLNQPDTAIETELEPEEETNEAEVIAEKIVETLIERGILPTEAEKTEISTPPPTPQEAPAVKEPSETNQALLEEILNTLQEGDSEDSKDSNAEITDPYSIDIPENLRKELSEIGNVGSSQSLLPPYFVLEDDLAASQSIFKNELAMILRESFLSGDYDTTIHRIKTLLLTTDPNTAYASRAYFYLGQSHLGNNEFSDALIAFLSVEDDTGIHLYNKRYISTLLERYPNLRNTSSRN